jgi:hypothetical protein
MMLTQVAVRRAIRWYGYSDGSGQQAMRLMRGVLGNHRKYHLAGMQILQSLRTGYQLAIRGENRRDTNQILGRDTGVAKS